MATGFVDPFGLAAAIDRIGFQGKRSGKVVFGIASALLAEGEVIECLCKGRYLDRAGVCVLTNTRLFIVNDNEWRPDWAEIRLAPGLTVQGWQDDRSAALIFTQDGVQVVIDKLSEREIAQEMAQRIRARIGE